MKQAQLLEMSIVIWGKGWTPWGAESLEKAHEGYTCEPDAGGEVLPERMAGAVWLEGTRAAQSGESEAGSSKGINLHPNAMWENLPKPKGKEKKHKGNQTWRRKHYLKMTIGSTKASRWHTSETRSQVRKLHLQGPEWGHQLPTSQPPAGSWNKDVLWKKCAEHL